MFVLALAREMDEYAILEADSAWPTSILVGLHTRFHRLAPELRQLLQYAAVIGPSFSLDILQSIWSNSAACTPYLLELEQAGWCQALPETHPAIYRFSHTLVWQVVYTSLSPSDCQQLHATIGYALEAQYPAPDISAAASMAYHYEQA
ncbi:hypothetical protein C2W62_34685 [Candidatus Entotheonella serta]|nr:hypothetical protein C2W62_34685 [Candidatus Entotheonella serta]